MYLNVDHSKSHFSSTAFFKSPGGSSNLAFFLLYFSIFRALRETTLIANAIFKHEYVSMMEHSCVFFYDVELYCINTFKNQYGARSKRTIKTITLDHIALLNQSYTYLSVSRIKALLSQNILIHKYLFNMHFSRHF